MIVQKMPKTARAVLYICAQREGASSLAADRAIEEGRAFAKRHGLRMVAEVLDAYGDPVPWRRSGWGRVREMAENGEMDVVIVRWPNALSPEREKRAPELDYLGRHGVQIRFSWAPLAVAGAGAPQ
ncbi:hypothetical protein [Streptomyces sp. NPDC093589]|uniref:hypothetical protein n=1 Tax=Streptomyces sp. NPDC093589 TaxID=3366043 RepID=UPI003805A26D